MLRTVVDSNGYVCADQFARDHPGSSQRASGIRFLRHGPLAARRLRSRMILDCLQLAPMPDQIVINSSEFDDFGLAFSDPTHESLYAFRTLIAGFEQALLDPRGRKGRRMAMQLWTEALRNPRILKTVRDGIDEPRRMLATIVARARDNGEMPKDIDPDAMARVMIALFQGFALQLAWDPKIDPKSFAGAVERIFAAILKRT
jgi:BetI-type transcriptional repressor, C-terminal